jgi:hypothetical protein
MNEHKSLQAAGDDKSGFKLQQLAFGQRVGLKTDSMETSVLEEALKQLTDVVKTDDLASVLDGLFKQGGGSRALLAGGAGDDNKPSYGYDPSVKWLAGFAMTYGVLSLQVLLVDGAFYGLLIKVGKKEGGGDEKSARALVAADEGGGEGGGDDDGPLAGLQLEIIYRKINDHLGEFSADLTLPDKFRKLKLGAASVTLPIIGLSIWTNGDFKVSIGWPLGDRSFNIEFPPDPIPWAGGGGLYFAKLRSEDSPDLPQGFDPIIEFGIALKIGAATEGNFSVVKYAASLYLFGSFQGFLAWREGHSFSDGIDYYWFCATVGITGHLEGSVDFVVISVSVSLDVTASVTMALETAHSTVAIARFTAEVTASIKILFFRIHFSFSLDVKIQVSFGSGPPAQITGPTPPSSPAFEAYLLNAALLEESAPAAALSVTGVAHVFVTAPAPVPVSLHFLLQPSIRYDAAGKNWLPVGVASLVIDRTAPAGGGGTSVGLGGDSFSLLVGSLASFLLATYGGYTDPTQNLTPANLGALSAALDAGQFDLQAVYNWLDGGNVVFTLSGAASGNDTDAAVFPMIPGLVLGYNGRSTTFGDARPPADYLTALKNYFARLSMVGDGSINESAHALLAASPQPPPASWFPGVVFADYFGIIAKQLYQGLADLKTQGTLANGLAQIDVGNLAGTATRFLQHGLRVPDPADIGGSLETMPLRGLYDLSGQQFDVAGGNAPVLSATLGGQAKVQLSFAGGQPPPTSVPSTLPFALTAPPTQSPLWSPRPLERIRDVALSFLLRQGVAWAEQQAGTSQTNRWLMYGFPDPLQSQLRLQTNLRLAVSSTDGSAAPAPAPGLTGLLVRFSLSLIPQLNPPGAALDYVFQVAGTDDETRDLMELLFESGALGDVEVELLLPAGAANSGAGYKTGTADNQNTRILKTNLSTYNQPNLSFFFAAAEAAQGATPLPPLGPTTALITDTANFLRLLWECSVVHGGGFYLNVPDLKASDFGSQQQLNVALLVKSRSAKPAPAVAVTNYNNVILLEAAGITPSARVQADVYQADGKTPVTQPQPNYPAGTLAFGAVWNNAPSEATAADTSDYATTLYQLLQFQLAGGNGIEDSGWSMPLGPDGDASTWVYQRAVPVYRFVEGAADPPNRYGAVGIQTTVNLGLEEVFGNAVALSPLHLAAVYNDQLISLDQWPGAAVVFAFGAGAGGNAPLTLTATFDPTQVSQPQTALPFYRNIYDQLTDPRAGMTVTTALAAGAVALKSAAGDDTQAALAKFVGAIIAYLSAGGGGAAPAALDLTGSVPVGYVSQIDEDLFPVWVSVTISRDAPQENVPYNYPPGFLSVTTQIPPLLNAAGNTDPAALRQWAVGFEKAFVNFDASNTLLKVLVGQPPSKVLATASKLGLSAAGSVISAPGDLWALKWGAESGVAVAFGNTATQPTPAQQPVYFAPLPLSTELITAAVPVNSYDPTTGKPTGSTPLTLSGVDMDLLARSFLQSVDALLTPSLATAIARLDAGQYQKLMTAKEELAYAISSNISWVFKDQLPPQPGQPGAGDITSAQVRFRENLLASLGSDFATSVIVQMPAAVSVKNQFESGQSAKAPELFGNPSPSASTSKTTLNQYTISTATLPVTAGTGHLNFLVGAVNPTTQSDLCLEFAYGLSFLDHQFQTSEEQFGYTPSSWLRFVVPDADPTGTAPVLDVPMGQLDIPVPLRAYPSPPRLVTQAAVASVPGATAIADALLADYQLQVARPQVAQDDLHLSVEFNGADFSLKGAADSGGQLFAALADFEGFQTQYLQTATDAITHSGAAAAQWLTNIIQLVQAVADAWQADAAAPNALGGAPGAPQIPAPYTWDFMLQVPDESSPNVLLLAWAGAGAPPAGAWPTIEGAAGQPTQEPNVMQYTLPSGADVDAPTLVWPRLSVITVQSVSATAWIVRNETLAGCGGQTQKRQTNQDFVYSTATVTFASAVIPLLTVTGKLPIQAASVDDAVGQLVTQVMTPASPVSQVGWGLQVEYSFVLVSGQDGQLQTKLPVFLARTDVTTAAQPPAGVETAQQLADALRGALKSWYGDFHPSDTGASLLFALTVFAANSQQPLARLFDIEAPISGPGWWNPPKPTAAQKRGAKRPTTRAPSGKGGYGD